MSDENDIIKEPSELICPAPEKPEAVEEIIKQVDAPPEIKSIIRESLFFY